MAVFLGKGIDHTAKTLYARASHLEDSLLARPQLQKGHRGITRGTYHRLLSLSAYTLHQTIANLPTALNINTHLTLGTDSHSHSLATMADANAYLRMAGQIRSPLAVMFQPWTFAFEQTA